MPQFEHANLQKKLAIMSHVADFYQCIDALSFDKG